MKKVAIIDMGTNTFHLLLAEVRSPEKYKIIHRDYEAVRIGKGGINEGFITEDACQRAIEAMKKFRRTIDDNGVERIYAFATSAVRNARNGRKLSESIEQVTGISIRTISGDEEAALIFEGIRAALDIGSKTSLVMDIGAGSVEFILGNRNNVLWKRSLEIGGQRLLEKFMKHDPIDQNEIEALDKFFSEVLLPLTEALRRYQPEVLVGSSGSFDTLSEIYCIRNGIAYPHGLPETPLTIDGFYNIYYDLIQKNREERMRIPGMIEMRVDMIVVACCLIRCVLESHPFTAIRVSSFSLKEGALARIAAEI